MALPPTSRIRFLSPAGLPIEQPLEWEPALIELLVAPDAWEHLHVRRQDELLPVRLQRIGNRIRVLADWPRSGTGSYRVRLDYGGETEERIFTIEPRKISPAAFAQLLDDLEIGLPFSVALGLQTLGALAGIKLPPPAETTVAQELVRLRRAILGIPGRPGLADLLPAIARDPHTVLHTTEFWVLTERARRPHPVRLAQAAARGQSLSPDGHPTQVLDTRVDHSVDVYENRLVKAYVEQVHRRLRHVSRLLQQPQYAIHRPEIQHLTTRLQLAWRQARFLEEVGELTQLSGHTTMVLLNRPKYRAALEGFLEFRRRATVRLEEPALVAPLENVPRLYQVWGTLKVITVLLQVAAEAGYRVHEPRLAGHDDSGVYIQVLPDGQLVLDLFHPVHGTQVKLIPERSYRTSGTLQSVSYVQRPDIAVEIERPGSSSEVYLFDPKYKLDSETLDADEPSGTPKKIDIDKMHAYRDAIRDATGHRVVTYAAIMYPGINVTYTDGLEALSAYPGATIALEQRLRHLLNTALAEPSA